MMDTAKTLLVKELALATAKKEQAVEEKIENIFM